MGLSEEEAVSTAIRRAQVKQSSLVIKRGYLPAASPEYLEILIDEAMDQLELEMFTFSLIKGTKKRVPEETPDTHKPQTYCTKSGNLNQ